MSIFTYTTANPVRTLTIDAEDRAAADTKFDQMRDAAGLTEESTIASVVEGTPMTNIVEHADLIAAEEAAKNSESNEENADDTAAE